MIFRKNVYLCRQNEENGHIISIFPVADLRCRLYSIALSSFVRRNRRYGWLLSRPSQGIFGKNRQQRQQRVLQTTGLQDKMQILGVYILRRDSDIEDAIQIFTKENNEPMLARALYYKGAMTFNTTHDTTQTLQILKQACRHSSIMRQRRSSTSTT